MKKLRYIGKFDQIKREFAVNVKINYHFRNKSLLFPYDIATSTCVNTFTSIWTKNSVFLSFILLISVPLTSIFFVVIRRLLILSYVTNLTYVVQNTTINKYSIRNYVPVFSRKKNQRTSSYAL